MAAYVWTGAVTTAWTTGANWKVGGVAQTVPPTAADDVAIGTGTGATNTNCVIGGAAVCRSLNCTSYTGTLSGSSSLGIGDGTAGAGNVALKLVSGQGFTYTGTITCQSTSATQQTIDTGGKTVGPFNISGTGGSYIFSANFTSSGQLQQTRGTVDYNGKTFSVLNFTSNTSSARTITLSAATFTCTTNTGNPWNFTDPTNLVFSAAGSTINFTGNGTRTFPTGGKTFGTVSIQGSGSVTLSGAATFGHLKRIGSAVNDFMSIPAGTTQTCTDFTATGASSTSRVWITTSAVSTQGTLALTNAPTLTNVSFMDIVVTGLTATGTRIGNGWNCSGITFDTPLNKYWVGGTGNFSDPTNHWATTSNGSPGVNNMPLPQDTMVFDTNSFSADNQTVSFDQGYVGGFDASAITRPAIFNFSAIFIIWFGNFKWSTLATNASASNFYTYNYPNFELTMNGGSFAVLLQVIQQRPGVTVTLQDDLNHPVGNWTVLAGTFDSNGKTMTTLLFVTTGAVARTVTITNSTINLTSTGSVWDATATGLTLNSAGSTINLTNTSATAKTFNGAGQTYYNLTVTPAGAGKVTFTGSNTFSNLFQGTGAKTLEFTAGTTTTAGTFELRGTASNVLTIQSTGAAATLSQAKGQVTGDYMTITASTVTGGATWNAGANSTDGGTNTGWSFTARSQPAVSLMGVGA